MIVYAGVLVINVLSTARQFIAHSRDRIELREQGEIIQLLRELEATGSGGLWELDGDLRVVKMSAELLAAMRLREEQVIGLPLPDDCSTRSDRSRRCRAACAACSSDLDSGTPFRDRAILSADRERWWSISGKPIHDEKGELVGWRGVASDITEARLYGDDAVRAARTDPLTGLANRLLVRELLEEAVLRQWEDQTRLRPAAGRSRPLQAGQRHARPCDRRPAAGRGRTAAGSVRSATAGASAASAATNSPSCGAAAATASCCPRVADRIIADLSKSFTIGAATLHVGATIGIAVCPADGALEEQLMRSADLALYRAKEAGRGGHAFFERYMFDEAEDHRLLEQDVRQALGGDGLTLAYQPIIDAATGEVVAREALLRWRHPKRGDIPARPVHPDHRGCRPDPPDRRLGDPRGMRRGGALGPATMRVAVNISAAQLTGAGLAKTVLGALAATRARAQPAGAGGDRERVPGRRRGDAGVARAVARARRPAGARRFRQGI